jgi:hypothetical protein
MPFGMGLTTPIRTLLIFETVNMRALDEAERAAIDATRSIHLQAQKLLMGGAAMATGLAAPMIFAASKIVQTASSLDLLMSKIQNVNQYSGKEMRQLGDEFTRMSKSLNLAPIDLAEAGYEAAQANYRDMMDIMKVAEVAGKTAIASGWEVSAKTAADQLTRLGQAFSIPISQADKMADALIRTQQVGKMSFEQIIAHSGKAAANYGALAQQMGTDPLRAMQEYMAMAATGTLSGLNADQMFTAMRGIMVRVFTESGQKGHMSRTGKTVIPGSKMNQWAQSLGFSGAGQMLEKKGMIEFLRLAKQRTGGTPGALQELGFKQRELTAVMSLMSMDFDRLDQVTKDIIESGGRLDAAFSRNMNTWKGMSERLKAAWQRLSMSWDKIVRPWAAVFTRILEVLASIFTEMPSVVKHLVVLSGVIVSLTSAILMLRGVMLLMVAKSEFASALKYARQFGAGDIIPRSNNAILGGYDMPGHLIPGALSAKERSGASGGASGWLSYLLGSVGFSLSNLLFRKLGNINASKFNPFKKRSLFAVPNPMDMQKLSGTIFGTRRRDWFTSIMGATYRMSRAGVDPNRIRARLAQHSVAGNATGGGFSGGAITVWLGNLMVHLGQFVNRLRTFQYAKFFTTIVSALSVAMNALRAFVPVLKFLASRAVVLTTVFTLMYAGIKDVADKVIALARSFWELLLTMGLIPDIMAFLQPLWEELAYHLTVVGNTILRMLNPMRLFIFITEVFKAVIDAFAAFVVPIVNLTASAFGYLAGSLLKVHNVITELGKGVFDFFSAIAQGKNILSAGKQAFWDNRDYAGKNTTVGNLSTMLFDYGKDRFDNIFSDSGDLFGQAVDHLMNAYNAYFLDLPGTDKTNKDKGKRKPGFDGDAMQPTRYTSALVYGTAAAYNDSITVSLLERIANNTDPNKQRRTSAVQLAQYSIGE